MAILACVTAPQQCGNCLAHNNIASPLILLGELDRQHRLSYSAVRIKMAMAVIQDTVATARPPVRQSPEEIIECKADNYQPLVLSEKAAECPLHLPLLQTETASHWSRSPDG